MGSRPTQEIGGYALRHALEHVAVGRASAQGRWIASDSRPETATGYDRRRSPGHLPDRSALDRDWPWLYHSPMNDAIGFALIHAAHRVEARLDEALAGGGLLGAKIGGRFVLVVEGRAVRLSRPAQKLHFGPRNVTQFADRLPEDSPPETD